MNTHNDAFYKNNFNLVRLFAAAQVAHFHLVSIYNMDIWAAHSYLVKFLGFFPGVPIFFFISGFLISKSWATSHSWSDYAIKRVARIEPALIVSVIFALVLTAASGYFRSIPDQISAGDIALLILAKTTILQFFNPEYLRDYGDGVLNGSLWTIVVEIQFYILIPILYVCFKIKNGKTLTLILLFIVFVICNGVYDFYNGNYPATIYSKLLKVSFFPWFFMFLCGAIFQKNFNFFYKHLSGRFFPLAIAYILACILGTTLGFDLGNSINPLLFIVLACLIFSGAYTNVNLANKLLGKTDVSYGVYLYHMPLINFCLYQQFAKSYLVGLMIAICIITISTISWFLIENPSLRFAKKITAKELN